MNANLAASLSLGCVASFLQGLHSAIVSAASLYIVDEFPVLADESRKYLMSLLVAAPLAGAIFGSFFFSRLSDIYGRRIALLAVHAVLIAASLCSCLAPRLWLLYVARFVLGLGIGGCTSVVPTYISEISPARIRGRCGALVQFSITSGVFSSYLLGYALSSVDSYQWRYMLGVPGLISLIPILFEKCIYESPRYLARNGKADEAKEIMSKFGSLLDFEGMVENIRSFAAVGTWTELFTNHRYALSVAIGIFALQQFSGINILVYYSGIIFMEMGFDKQASLLVSAASSIPQLIVIMIVVFSLDRRGRKPLLLTSITLVMAFVALISVATFLQGDWRKWLSLASIVGAKMAFATGLGPIPAVLCSESMPNQVRSKGMAIASLTHWFSNGVVSFAFLPLLQLEGVILGREPGTHGSYVYLLFSGVCFFGLFWVWFWISETANLRLEEVAEITAAEDTDEEAAKLLWSRSSSMEDCLLVVGVK